MQQIRIVHNKWEGRSTGGSSRTRDCFGSFKPVVQHILEMHQFYPPPHHLNNSINFIPSYVSTNFLLHNADFNAPRQRPHLQASKQSQITLNTTVRDRSFLPYHPPDNSPAAPRSTTLSLLTMTNFDHSEGRVTKNKSRRQANKAAEKSKRAQSSRKPTPRWIFTSPLIKSRGTRRRSCCHA